MCKKQLLKVGKKGKIIAGVGLGIILIGTIEVGGQAIGNITDTPYTSYSTNGITTESRSKRDDTSAYIFHKGDISVNVEVRNGGKNYTAGKGSYQVQINEKRFLDNYIYENNKSSCYLFLRQTGSGRYNLHGLWSPDSI